MRIDNIVEIILYFAFYSFVGWLCETIYCSVGQRKLVRRGFLYGPYCPIYGFGAIAILVVGLPLEENPVLVFLAAMVAASALEYFTSWLMEKLFKTHWWNYSAKKFNLNGRICLKNSILFGFLGIAAVYFVHPLAEDVLRLIPVYLQGTVAAIVFVGIILDTVLSVLSVLKLKERVKMLKTFYEQAELYDAEHHWYIRGDITGSVQRLGQICEEDKNSQAAQELLKTIHKVIQKYEKVPKLVKSFPKIEPKEFGEELAHLKDYWKQKAEEIAGKRKRK